MADNNVLVVKDWQQGQSGTRDQIASKAFKICCTIDRVSQNKSFINLLDTCVHEGKEPISAVFQEYPRAEEYIAISKENLFYFSVLYITIALFC